MNWYFALNEGGTQTDIALHTKLAVLSARRHTSLTPKLLYIGHRNDFTRWMEAHEVEVLDQTLPYLDTIQSLIEINRYSAGTLGHWLRTNVCLVERAEDRALYTDVDVYFRRNPELNEIRPNLFSAAPEFYPDAWNYFNSGVMVMNTPGLRQDYDKFEDFIRLNLNEKAPHFLDQDAYNIFYHGRWERLPTKLNWKPYWGVAQDAEIVHFHGPKLGAIEAIINNRWDWNNNHGLQIGTLLLGNLESYRHYVGSLLGEASGLLPAEADRLYQLSARLNTFTPDPDRKTDVSFMSFRMFPD